MATTLETHLAARKANQEAVGTKLSEILDLITQAETDGLYPDGLTSELFQVQICARVNAKRLCPPAPPEDVVP